MESNSEIGIVEIQQFYNSDALHKFQSLSSRQTFLEICKKRISETVHSAVLKWLFENNEFARLPLSPIVTLLRLYASKAYEQKTDVDKTFINEILSGKIKSISNVQGFTEQSIKDNRRVDIELLFDLDNGAKGRICIENKLFTKEHDNQCGAYYDHFTSKHDGRKNLFIFLSPEPTNVTNERHFVNLLYQDLYDSVLYPLFTHYKEHHSERSIAYLKDYIDTLTSISEEYKPIVMSTEYKELLTELYKNHRDLFFEAISFAGTEEDKAMINQATGGNYEYKITYGNQVPETVTGFTKMARRIIELLMEYGVSENEIITNLGEVRIQGFDSSVAVFADKMRAQSRYSKKPIETGNATIYVSNQWKKEKADSFIKLVKEKGYPINVEMKKKL